MKRVLFVGDINVDIIMGCLESFPIPDREITCASFDITMGSSAVIAACAYASLGGSTAFLGLAGEDEYGRFMLRGLNESGIDTSRVRCTTRVKTGVTLNLIHEGQRTQVTYPGTISEFDGSDVGERDLDGIDHIHFAGPYLQAKFRPHITRILGMAESRGMTTSLDPQWDASERWEYMEEWLPLLDYFFPNLDEAKSITKTQNAQGALEALAKRTPCPVVKAGAEGALVFDGSRVCHSSPPAIRIVDTTGAGDSMAAGFLYACLEQNAVPEAALRYGTMVAARSCTFVGGINARSTAADIAAFMEKYK